mmetsp:Transcript_38691/g.99338  ORF Transcript_38691/g.99338 Transcript_38691/m.99338 type:complete len:378 (-) Transcript_38691:499-1632(-)
MSLLQALAESKRRVSRLERSAREESTSSKSQPGDASSASLSMSKKSGGEVQNEVNREEECNSHGRKGEKDAVSELFFDVKQVIDELHALVSAGEQKRLVSKLRVLIDDESLLLSSRIAAVKSECARLEADNAMLSARAEDAEMLVTHTARESEETVEKISALWEKRLESQQKAAEKNWKESRREWEREEAKLRASFREELERERADAQQLLSKIEAEMKEEKERAEEEKSRLEAEMEEEKERMKAAADREKKEVEDRYQLEKDRLFALHQSAMLKLKEKREEDGKTWRSEKEKVREKIDKMRQRLDGVEKSRDKLRAEVEEEKEKVSSGLICHRPSFVMGFFPIVTLSFCFLLLISHLLILSPFPTYPPSLFNGGLK